MSKSWTREDVFGDKWSPHPLEELIEARPPVAWGAVNRWANDDKAELKQWIGKQAKWRYHHGLDFLHDSPGFYAAYARRVDTMFAMVKDALQTAGVDPAMSSFVDLGAAEGYTSNLAYDLGARDIDSCDFSEINIERLWKIRAFTDRLYGRVGTIDLEHVEWSAQLGRTYDVALALGVVYHMENPMLFCRNLHKVAPVAIVESDTPVFPQNERFRGFGNIYLHRDQVTQSIGEDGKGRVRYLTELRPDRQALVELLLNAGFTKVVAIEPPPSAESHYYVSGEKSVLIAYSN